MKSIVTFRPSKTSNASASQTPSLRPIAALGLVVLSMVTFAGCAIEPWVKPYERHNFADPIMSSDRDPVASAYIHHVYQAREGARGAEGGSGGGCGCN